MSPALIAAAEAAAKAGQWRTLHLRLTQMRRLKVPSDIMQKYTRMQEFIATPEKPYRNPEGIDLLWCKQGTFLMGSAENEPERGSTETQHEVTLSSGFWLAKTELTQEQWIAVMGTNPSTNPSKSPKKVAVDNISWNEAMNYCRRLTDRERARGTIPPGWEYSLPTEEQWEYACRAGSQTVYSFGDDPAELHKHGNYYDISENFEGRSPGHVDGNRWGAYVAGYQANGWGFHDMHGNVLEWCRDKWVTDPLGPVPELRGIRGGGFESTAAGCRVYKRYANPPAYRSNTLGFRPAVSYLGLNHTGEARVSGGKSSGVSEDVE